MAHRLHDKVCSANVVTGSELRVGEPGWTGRTTTVHIVTRWSGSGGTEAYLSDQLASTPQLPQPHLITDGGVE